MADNNISSTSLSLDACFETLSSLYDVENIEKPVKISTMTLLFKTLPFDVEELYANALDSQKTFRNCIIIKDGVGTGKICIKIFKNGGLHVTGPKKMGDALTHLKAKLPGVSPTSVSIQMLNTTFKFARDVDMSHTYAKMVDQPCFVSYDTSIHAAMNIKFKGFGGALLLYRTGSVVMAGFKNPESITEAFKFLTGFFDKYPECLKTRIIAPVVLKKRGRKSNASKDAYYMSLLSNL